MKKLYLLIIVCIFSMTAQSNNTWKITSLFNSLNTPNFNKIKDVKQLKSTFFEYMLPLVVAENRKIKMTRIRIKNNQLNRIQIQALAKKYHLKKINKDALLYVIDTIPTSLVLAQAAIESNWGRSRFARYWNNYFGIWCFTSGCGVVPENRNKGAKHEVMNFASAGDSIGYYLKIINRNQAYQLLRDIRAYKRKHRLKLTGKSLSEGLDKYSEAGYEYIELIQSIIRQNKLGRFD